MHKEDIIKLPHKNLRKKSAKITKIDKPTLKLIKEMGAATLDWEDSREHEQGVALAAVQVNMPKRIIVIRRDFQDKSNRKFTAFINPKIISYGGGKVSDFEGCLSVPDVYGKVPRYQEVEIEALSPQGKPVRLIADGFLARVFQHEIDHTDGILFIDRIKNKRKAFYNLNDDGKLKPLDYEKDIQKNSILWQ